MDGITEINPSQKSSIEWKGMRKRQRQSRIQRIYIDKFMLIRINKIGTPSRNNPSLCMLVAESHSLFLSLSLSTSQIFHTENK